MDKIFVTGASGLLGSNIIETLPTKFEVYGSYNKNKVTFKNCSLIKMDITNPKQTKSIEKINPDLLIHCAAFVDVDGCEKDPENAYLQNVVSTKNIIKISETVNSFLIYISTDSVFDGNKGNYSEEDQTNPINVYGKTKLEAEEVVKKSDIDYCIIRTNIYGWNKINKFSLAEWMINQLEMGKQLPAFYDVVFTPIFVNNLSQALLEIYKKKIRGLLNVSGSESCNKFEFAEKIADVFYLNKDLINRTSIDNLNLTAKRGKNLSLNIKKAKSLLDTELLDVEEGLQEMKKLKDIGYLKEFKEK